MTLANHLFKASRDLLATTNGLMPGEEKTSRLRTQLYHAAHAYSFWSMSKKADDFELAKKFTKNLEDAADAWSMR